MTDSDVNPERILESCRLGVYPRSGSMVDWATLEKVVTRLTMKNELMERALKEFPTRPGRSRR